jgi:allantoinase
MSAAPAALAGISDRAGALAPGREASFVIFDTEAEWTATTDHLHTRHATSPYVGECLTGRVEATYLRGECVWNGAEFEDKPRGREITLC